MASATAIVIAENHVLSFSFCICRQRRVCNRIVNSCLCGRVKMNAASAAKTALMSGGTATLKETMNTVGRRAIHASKQINCARRRT